MTISGVTAADNQPGRFVPAPNTRALPEAKAVWSASRDSAVRTTQTAQPATRTSSTAVTPAGNTLGWRQPKVPSQRAAAVSKNSAPVTIAVHLTETPSGGRSQNQPAVRRTVMLSPAGNPFEDPFGDRFAQAQGAAGAGSQSGAGSAGAGQGQTSPGIGQPPGSTGPTQGLPAQQPADPLPDPDEVPDFPQQPEFVPPAQEDTFGQPSPSDQPRDTLAPPPEAPGTLPPPQTSPYSMPERGLSPDDAFGESAQNCQRIYNGRDCCREGDQCAELLESLRSRRLADISLDITYDFAPERDKDVELAQAASRVWRDRDGEVIAEGRLTDLQQGRVIITTESGETVEHPYRQLSEDDVCFVAAWWFLPMECALGDDQFLARSWLPMDFHWKASALCHKPLYFEEVQVERYGHTAGPLLQPVVSGAHFFVNIAILPYKMGIHPLSECQYALGYYRPGSCAPWLVPPVPISLRGGLAQAAAVAGGIYVIP